MDNLIFHIDVNSAFLSWEATYRIKELNETEDIRNIPSIIGGDETKRHGIVLAKSTPAKAFSIVTGEPIVKARQKCPDIKIFPTNFKVYKEYSDKFISLLKKYAPVVEQFSIDEAFLNMTGTNKLYGDPVIFAHKLKDEIKTQLGFTVNIGISSNKLLAKMASDFQKPDKVHTLFPDEIPQKLWPLDIRELLYVGKSTADKLHLLGINTIGDAANTNINLLTYHFKKQGSMIWNYANGIDDSTVAISPTANKGYGNSTTLSEDITSNEHAKIIILSLCENIGARLREDKKYIGVVSISLVDNDFNHQSKQISLSSSTNVTEEIYDIACKLFDSCWMGNPIRLIGVSTSKATDEKYSQYNMFDMDKYDKLSKLDNAIDNIRNKYGDDSVKRARFINSKYNHMTGKK